MLHALASKWSTKDRKLMFKKKGMGNWEIRFLECRHIIRYTNILLKNEVIGVLKDKVRLQYHRSKWLIDVPFWWDREHATGA